MVCWKYFKVLKGGLDVDVFDFQIELWSWCFGYFFLAWQLLWLRFSKMFGLFQFSCHTACLDFGNGRQIELDRGASCNSRLGRNTPAPAPTPPLQELTKTHLSLTLIILLCIILLHKLEVEHFLNNFNQGILNEGEGSLQLISLYQLAWIRCNQYWDILYIFLQNNLS